MELPTFVVTGFAIGTRVVDKNNHTKRGAVLGTKRTHKNTVAVEWDDGRLTRTLVSDLLTEESLNASFDKLKTQVNEKLAQAGALILEASDLAKSGGKSLHSDDDDNYDKLFNIGHVEHAMGQAGWNTSSWYC